MKHLKSSFVDLRRIFEQSITVRSIAEPLASFEQGFPADRAREFMTRRGYDVVGVSRNGAIQRCVLREDLELGTVGEHARDLREDDLLEDSDPLLHAAEALRSRGWIFVRFLGHPSGIVTHGDLQKAPMRMWLFGLISLLEMQMLRRIRNSRDDDDWWRPLLSEERVASAMRVFQQRLERNEEICLSDCLHIIDKATIFRKTDELFAVTGFSSKQAWKSLMVRIEDLRNNLAHANDLGTGSWPDIAPLVIQIEQLLTGLESEDTNAEGRASCVTGSS